MENQGYKYKENCGLEKQDELKQKAAHRAVEFVDSGMVVGLGTGSTTAFAVIRIGERMGLDTDGDGNEQNDPGWGRRAMFLIDRSELINAWDEGSGTFDWERLVKFRVDLDIN